MFTYMAGRPVCDKITTALAAQALAALSINDYKGAWRLAEELKKRWAKESVKPDPKQLGRDEGERADDCHPAKYLVG